MNSYSILAIIPARGGSKGIERKNIKLLHGKPLIAYSIETALQCKRINRIAVTTEDDEIYKFAQTYDINLIKRPKELAKDSTPTLPVIQHAIDYIKSSNNFQPDIIVLLQPTSPLRTVQDINNCISKLIREKCDTVISVKKLSYPLEWIVKKDNIDRIQNYFPNKKITRRQASKDHGYLPNGAVYVFWSDTVMKKKKYMVQIHDHVSCLMSDLLILIHHLIFLLQKKY